MKILILTCNTGGGHNAAVAALRRELAIKGLRREAKLRLIETALAAPGTPDSR